MLLVTGCLFFSFVLYRDVLPTGLLLFGMTPLMLTVLLGAIQNILSKSCKYSLFDPTKEMSYIPLSIEEKIKGKAAVDVIGNPTGKSTGSLIQQVLMISMGSLSVIAPYVASIVFVFFAIWLVAAKSLGKQFNALLSEQDRDQNERSDDDDISTDDDAGDILPET
jgi:AAA family ATP:ADP antiporter